MVTPVFNAVAVLVAIIAAVSTWAPTDVAAPLVSSSGYVNPAPPRPPYALAYQQDPAACSVLLQQLNEQRRRRLPMYDASVFVRWTKVDWTGDRYDRDIDGAGGADWTVVPFFNDGKLQLIVRLWEFGSADGQLLFVSPDWKFLADKAWRPRMSGEIPMGAEFFSPGHILDDLRAGPDAKDPGEAAISNSKFLSEYPEVPYETEIAMVGSSVFLSMRRRDTPEVQVILKPTADRRLQATCVFTVEQK